MERSERGSRNPRAEGRRSQIKESQFRMQHADAVESGSEQTMNKPERHILTDLTIDETSVCDIGANGYSRILLRKRDIDAAIEAAILAHKKRLAKAVTRATSSADFDRRTAKSSAKCDREVAPLLAKLSENFECNPDPASLEADDGFAERDRRRRA